MPDREDLLRQATALSERVEFRILGESEPVVVGFRRDGAASFFFGPDPVYQFNAAGELRRAFVSGLLYKAERGRLVALRRERSATETALLRAELTDAENAAFLATMQQQLSALDAALTAANYQRTGHVPEHADVLGRISQWLGARPAIFTIAGAPNAVQR